MLLMSYLEFISVLSDSLQPSHLSELWVGAKVHNVAAVFSKTCMQCICSETLLVCSVKLQVNEFV